MTIKGNFMKIIIAYTILLFLIVGCATQQAYEGSKKSTDELSIISPLSPSLFRFGHPPLAIREVDGIRLDKLKSGAFETLPGKHTIIVTKPLGLYQSTSPVKMIFNTENGKKYIVDYKDSEGGKLTYFVHEEGSEKIIYKIEQ